MSGETQTTVVTIGEDKIITPHIIDLRPPTNRRRAPANKTKTVSITSTGEIQVLDTVAHEDGTNSYVITTNPEDGSLISAKPMGSSELTEEATFQCSVCWKTYNNPQGLKTHMKNHDPTEQVDCEICMKTFRTSRHLQSHMYVHAEERTWKCHICPQAFKRKSDHSRHLARHADKRLYKCDICGSGFNDSPTMRKHRTTHINTEYQCPFCDTVAQRAYTFKTHIKTEHADRVTSVRIMPDLSVEFTSTLDVAESDEGALDEGAEKIEDGKARTTVQVVPYKAEQMVTSNAAKQARKGWRRLTQTGRVERPQKTKADRKTDGTTIIYMDGTIGQFSKEQNQDLILTQNATLFDSLHLTAPQLSESYYDWLHTLTRLMTTIKPPLNPRLLTVAITVEQTVKELLVNPTEYDITSFKYKDLLTIRDRLLAILRLHFNATWEKMDS